MNLIENTIENTIKNIKKIDEESMILAKKRQESLLKPSNSLGYLEDITIKLAGIYRNANLAPLKKAILIFGSDNDVYEEKVSKDKQELTAWHFPNLTQDYSAIGSICKMTNTKIVAVDLGVKTKSKMKNVVDEKISFGVRNMTKEQAMTREQAIKSIEIGIKYANQIIDDGYNMLFIGEMGICNTTSATAIVSAIANKKPKEITGRGSGVNDEFLHNKIDSIEKALKLHKVDKKNYLDILMKIGGYENGAMLGVILACASRNIPIVLDGLITYSSAMLATLVSENVKDYVIITHKTREKAGNFALEYLGFNPIIDMNLCLGEGYGAVIFSQIIDGAIYSYNNMYTFSQTIEKNGII